MLRFFSHANDKSMKLINFTSHISNRQTENLPTASLTVCLTNIQNFIMREFSLISTSCDTFL